MGVAAILNRDHFDILLFPHAKESSVLRFFASCVSHAFAFGYCCLVVIWWERVGLFALVGDVYWFFCYFPMCFLAHLSQRLTGELIVYQ